MPPKRFLGVSHYLHFVNNTTIFAEDKIRKVRPVVDFLNANSETTKFQYIKSKRGRFGIKFYKLCESNSSCCYRFTIYTGQYALQESNKPVSESIAIQLVESILGKGYTLFLDNWYSSTNLYKILQIKNTNVVATVRKNWKNVPKKLAPYKLKKEKPYAGMIRRMYLRSNHEVL